MSGRLPHQRLAAALLALALLASACGSTVQQSGLDAGAGATGGPVDGQALAGGGLGAGGAGLAAPGAAGSTGTAPTSGSRPAGTAAGQTTGAAGGAAGGAGSGSAGGAGGGGGGATTGATSPGAPAPAGPAGGPAPAAGADGADLPPMRVGFAIVDAAGLEAFGNTGGEDVGSSDSQQRQNAAQAEIEALVRWANETGGLNGRQVEAVTRTITLAEASNESAMGGHCAGATQDQQVEAFIDHTAMNEASVVQCFANAGVPLIAGTLSFHHGDFIRSVAPYVASTTATLDRIGQTYVPGLEAAGYFEGAGPVGVLLDDTADLNRVYEEVIAPDLAARGIEPTVFRFSADGSQGGPQGANAVLQMRTAGVTHVLSVISFLNYLGFIAAADAQGFRPRYGFSDYAEGASIAGFYGSDTQNARAIAVSSSDTYVLEPAQEQPRGLESDLDPQFMSPGARRCADVLGEYRDQDYYSGGSDKSLAWLFYCNHFFLFVDAARQVEGPVTSDTWHTGLARLGTYESSFTIGTSFGPGIFDGASQYVIGEFSDVPGCKCFIQIGEPLAFPARS